MSTLLTPRPAVRDRRAYRGAAAKQESLFGDGPIGAPEAARAAAAPVREPETRTAGIPSGPQAAPSREEPRPATRTLDAAIKSLWDQLMAAEEATCPICDGPMEPVRSTASGVAGGRCRSCGSTLA